LELILFNCEKIVESQADGAGARQNGIRLAESISIGILF
jgi:hypothetical protein